MNSRKLISIYLIFVCITLCSGCSKEQVDVSDLQVLGDESAESADDTQEVIIELEEVEVSEESVKEDTDIISVYICGAVNQEGVYELEYGSRIYQAIELAGGMTEEAMATYLNLAQELEDGQKVYVPTIEEVEAGLLLGELENAADNGSTSDSNTAKVNINSASKEELMSLNGIGESKAESIIEYRTTYGAFESIEDLMNITGIKEGVYDQVKDDITVS